MATYKRTDGDYSINTINSDDNVLITTHTVKVYGNLEVNGDQLFNGDAVINGNLNVEGNITYIDVTDLIVADPFITVAANNQGNLSNALFTSQGLVAQTGSNIYAGLRFNNTSNAWQISTSVDSNGGPINPYENIITPSTVPMPGGSQYSIQVNIDNEFYGDNDLIYDPTVRQISLDGYIVMYDVLPTGVFANGVAVYHQPVGAGGSGLYVKTSTIDDELCSRKKAIIFGLIF